MRFPASKSSIPRKGSPQAERLAPRALSDPGICDSIRAELNRVTHHPLFAQSARCRSLLTYVIEATLDGATKEELKERTVGVRVFGRPPAYDTGNDSIVRVTANDVRKRLDQYYRNPANAGAIVIDLPIGSYVPEFRRALPLDAAIGNVLDEPEVPLESLPPLSEEMSVEAPEAPSPVQADQAINGAIASAISSRRMKRAALAAALLLSAITALLTLRGRSDAGLNRFWGPVLEPSTPVLICVGTVEPAHISPDFRSRFTPQMADNVNGVGEALVPESTLRDWPAVTWTDAVEMTRITEMLTRHGKSFQLRSSDSVTLADLRKGPVILLGVLENSWTLRLVSKLRFRPRMDFATQKMWIEDSQHPERKDWSAPWGVAYSDSHDDYALVTRTINPLSGQVSIEIGGLGLHASQAAGEFVTNPAYMNSLSRSLRDQNKNVQIVLKINVIKGEAGPPQIIAGYYW